MPPLDIFNATDEEIANAPMPDFEAEATAAKPEEQQTQEDDTPAEGEVENTDANEEDEDETPKPAEEPENPEAEEIPAETDTTKSDLDRIYAPFMANGKEIKVDNADDAIRLMQMGAGFNKKMAALKPHLKLVKMLQNNDLLDESKLSYLIDLNKKNPEAISKLLAESQLDPLNLPQGKEYTPNTYTVDDIELELDDVFTDLKESPHYIKTLDIVGNKWDVPSKKLLISNPTAIRTLHDHISSGIFDQVIKVVEKERLLGRLNGLSDLEAYKQVGDAMDAQGLFKPAAAPVVDQTKLKADESKLKSRKLAASPTKSSPGVKKSPLGDFNPLTATDEEIANMSIDKFL